MNRRTAGPRRAFVLAGTAVVILLILYLTMLLADIIYRGLAYLLGLPASIYLGLEVRLIGLALFVVGIGVGLDVLRFRRPLDILVSTSDTMLKLIRRRPLEERTRRTEPFIPRGPYVYVRNPMYFAAIAIIIGYGLSVSSLPLILWGLIMTCWLWFFQIPFEERELHALFGESYMDYRRQAPKLFPYGKKYRPKRS